jgi:hypothetical protein
LTKSAEDAKRDQLKHERAINEARMKAQSEAAAAAVAEETPAAEEVAATEEEAPAPSEEAPAENAGE